MTGEFGRMPGGNAAESAETAESGPFRGISGHFGPGQFSAPAGAGGQSPPASDGHSAAARYFRYRPNRGAFRAFGGASVAIRYIRDAYGRHAYDRLNPDEIRTKAGITKTMAVTTR